MVIRTSPKPFTVMMTCLVAFSLAGCGAAYYKTMEKLGYHKRDIMVSRVHAARDSQEAAKEQFQSALEQFTAVLQFKGGTLEDKYTKLDAEYNRSKKKAEEVSSRIDSVESVAEALFSEWERELDTYTNKNLRRSSKRKMDQTRRQYERLMRAMRQAESRIAPVLDAFRDQVLFLKHNLNAQAIASMQGELATIQSDVALLINEMEASIGEADTFIHSMGE